VIWVLLAWVPVVPIYHGAFLGAVAPLAGLYFILALGSSLVAPLVALSWFAGHLLATAVLTVCASWARRRWRSTSYRAAVATCAVAYLVGAGWVINECRRGGRFFDSGGVYHDVSALVRSQQNPSGQFASAQDVADRVEQRCATYGDGYGPRIVAGIEPSQSVLATGTWPQHWRLDHELEQLRGE